MKKRMNLFARILLVFSLMIQTPYVSSAATNDVIIRGGGNGTGDSVPAGISMTGVAYGNNTYVIVGNSGFLLTSSDVARWTTVKDSSFLNENYSDVEFGNGIFVAITSNGKIITSTNGTDWTQQNSGTTNSLNDIKFINGTFYVVGNNGTVLTSTNGSLWSLINVGAGASMLKNIDYGGNTYVIGGRDASGNGTYVYYSTTGTANSWTQRSVSSTSALNKIKFLNNAFIIFTHDSKVFTSTSASSWTEFTNVRLNSPNQVFDGFYDGSKYYLFGNSTESGYGSVFTSTDGNDFTLEPKSAHITIQKSEFVNGKYFQLGNEGFLVSSDGIKWRYTANSYFSVASNGSNYVAVGGVSDGADIYISLDWKNWTNVTPSYIKANFNGVTYGGGKYVAVGNAPSGSNSISAVSSDGINWTVGNSGVTDNLRAVAYGGSTYVGVGLNGRILSSGDGVNWTSRDQGSGYHFYGVAYVNNLFVAVGGSPTLGTGKTKVKYSTDGISWIDASPDIVGHFHSIAYGAGKYVLVGRDNTSGSLKFFSVSTNDITNASSYSSAVTVPIKVGTAGYGGVAYDNGTFVAIANETATPNQAYILTSTDGTSWTATDAKTTGRLRGIISAGGNFKVVGTNDTKLIVAAGITSINAVTPIISTHPSNNTVNVGDASPTLKVTASVSDEGTLSYQWYSNTTNSNAEGTLIDGATSPTWNVPTTTSGTTYYYVVVTNTNSGATGNKTATVVSDPAKVTVNAPTSTYTITYAAGAHGTISTTSETVVDGGKPSAVPTVTPDDGYTFAGWSSDGGVTKLTSAQVAATTVNGDLTYTAYYTKNQYAVNFEVYGGSSVLSQTVNHGEKVTRPTDPTKAGYTFDGWYTDNECKNAFNFNTNIIESTTLHAKWLPAEAGVTVTVGNVKVGKGQTVEVPVSINKPSTGIAAYGIKVDFDPNIFEDVEVVPNDPDDIGFDSNVVKDQGFLMVGWIDITGGEIPISSASELFKVKLKVKSDAPLGVSSLTIDKTNKLNLNFSDVDAKDIRSDAVNGSVTIVNSYNVSFGVNGGSSVDSQMILENEKVSKPANPTRAGYTFGGWYTDTKSDTPFDFNSTEITKNTTVYAKWVPNKYKVSFDVDGGSEIQSQTINYGEKATEPTVPTKDGYIFGGWYKESGLKNAWDFETEELKENTTIYAKWNLNQYKVSFDSDEGSSVADQTVNHGEKVTKPADPTKVGHTFVNWYEDNVFSKLFDFANIIITKATSIFAKWTPNEYKVSFDSNGGSSVTDIAANYDTTITAPTAPTKEGSTFAGWYKESKLMNVWDFETENVKSNTTLYAKWILKEYQISFDVAGGSVTNGEKIAHGNKVTKPTNPTKPGYTFAGWYTDNKFATPFDFEIGIISDTTIYAKWTKNIDPSPMPGPGPAPDPTPGPTMEQIVVDVVDDTNPNELLVRTPITRTKEKDGTVKDSVIFNAEKAAESVSKLENQETKIARIIIPDEKDQVSETKIEVPKQAINALKQGETNLSISTANGTIFIPTSSLTTFTDDLYFRIVPVKKAEEQTSIETRAKQEEKVREVVKDKTATIEVLGRPMTIETNMQSRPVTLTFPLPVNITQDQKDNLAIFIEHSDGTKEVVRGQIVEIKKGQSGVQFSVNKFSTFTALYMDGAAEYFDNGNAGSCGKTPLSEKHIGCVNIIEKTSEYQFVNNMLVAKTQLPKGYAAPVIAEKPIMYKISKNLYIRSSKAVRYETPNKQNPVVCAKKKCTWKGRDFKPKQIGQVTILQDTDVIYMVNGKERVIRQLKKGTVHHVYHVLPAVYELENGRYVLKNAKAKMVPIATTVVKKPIVDRVTDQSKVISGKAENNVQISIQIGEKTWTTRTDNDGNFSLSIPKQKPKTVISIVAQSDNGKISEEATIHVEDVTSPASPKVEPITTKSKRIYGITEPKATVNIYISNKYIGKINAYKNGKFSFNIQPQKANTVIKLIASDEAGNQSKPSVIKVK